MRPWKERHLLLAALVLLGFAGLLAHARVHPFVTPTGLRWSVLPATLLSLADVLLVTFLFTRRGTAVYGYVLNGFLVIYGTVLMGHFSIATLAAPGTHALDWISRSTFIDIVIAGADFLIGKALYQVWMKGEGGPAPSVAGGS
jgi:hypothetical protein